MKKRTKEMKVIVLGPYCWGEGPTVEEAWNEAKREWPSHAGAGKPDKTKAKFYLAPKAIYVNDMGGLSGPQADHDDIIEIPVAVPLKEG